MSDFTDSELEIQASLEEMIGPYGEPESMSIDYLAARRMALAVDNFDPIHYEHEAAVARGYRGVVATWPILVLIDYTCHIPGPPFKHGATTVHGEDEYEYFEPIVVGDEITMDAAVTDAKLKRGRSGLLQLRVREHRYTNQLGQLCAIQRTTAIRR